MVLESVQVCINSDFGAATGVFSSGRLVVLLLSPLLYRVPSYTSTVRLKKLTAEPGYDFVTLPYPNDSLVLEDSFILQ